MTSYYTFKCLLKCVGVMFKLKQKQRGWCLKSLFLKEGNYLFNDALNTFYLRLYGVGHMVKNHSDSDYMSFSFRLTVRVLLYAPFHREDSTYHGLCYTSRGALAKTRNSSMGPQWRIDPTTLQRTFLPRSYISLGYSHKIWKSKWPT